MVASHSYGWDNGNKHQSPCHRYGIKNNNSKYNIRYLTASMVILTTLHTSHKNGRLPILNASGIIKRKNKKQYSTMDTSETGLEKVWRVEWLRATLNCFRRNSSANERCQRHQTLVASHSYGWNNGKQPTIPMP